MHLYKKKSDKKWKHCCNLSSPQFISICMSCFFFFSFNCFNIKTVFCLQHWWVFCIKDPLMIKYKKKKKWICQEQIEVNIKLELNFITYFHYYGKKIYTLKVRILGKKIFTKLINWSIFFFFFGKYVLKCLIFAILFNWKYQWKFQFTYLNFLIYLNSMIE